MKNVGEYIKSKSNLSRIGKKAGLLFLAATMMLSGCANNETAENESITSGEFVAEYPTTEDELGLEYPEKPTIEETETSSTEKIELPPDESKKVDDEEIDTSTEDSTIEYNDSEEYGVDWARAKAERIAADLEAIDDWVVDEIRQQARTGIDGETDTFYVSASFREFGVRFDVHCSGLIVGIYYYAVAGGTNQIIKEWAGTKDEIHLLSPAQISVLDVVR